MQWTINCDLGEGMSNDQDLMPYIQLCNIACGGHTGNASSMHKTIELAQKHQVLIGAHPSYPDPMNFGRKSMVMKAEKLIESITNQILELDQISNSLGSNLHHVKPHGALYNDSVKNEFIAQVIVQVMSTFPTLLLMVPHHSLVAQMALAEGIGVVEEAFADRQYLTDGSLAPRNLPNSVIVNAPDALKQVSSIWSKSMVISRDGIEIPLYATSFCLHGDNPQALEIAKALKALRDG